MSIKTFSFGGGVQSTAALVLAAQGRIDYREFVFANVGEDSENPATFDYLHRHAMPFAKAHGLTIHVIDRIKRDGTKETLWGRMTKPGYKGMPIPVRLNQTGAPWRRSCTYDFKVDLISKWLRKRGATTESPAVTGIGISLDEYQRMRDSRIPWQNLDYPLVDLRIDRQDCENIIRGAGLPVPPKSSCFFCPFHSIRAWQQLYDEQPELFERAVWLERFLNERQAQMGYEPVWLTDKLKPLDEVVDGAHRNQLVFDFDPSDGQYDCGPFVCAGGAA